jgi:hypothetical protein
MITKAQGLGTLHRENKKRPVPQFSRSQTAKTESGVADLELGLKQMSLTNKPEQSTKILCDPPASSNKKLRKRGCTANKSKAKVSESQKPKASGLDSRTYAEAAQNKPKSEGTRNKGAHTPKTPLNEASAKKVNIPTPSEAAEKPQKNNSKRVTQPKPSYAEVARGAATGAVAKSEAKGDISAAAKGIKGATPL